MSNLGSKRSLIILVSFLIVVIFFSSLELFLRCVGFRMNYNQQVLFSFLPFYNKLDNLRYFTYDRELLWRNDEVIKNLNFNEGSDTLRIICLGDSTTAGYHLSEWDENYPLKLERELNSLFGFGKVKVVNAGVGGYSSYQGLLLLKKYILKLKPDIVILKFGINDSAPALPLPDNQRKVSIREEKIDRFFNHFRLYQLFKFIKCYLFNQYYMKNQRELPLRVNLQDFRRNIEEMVQLAHKDNIFVILMTSPSLQEDYFLSKYNRMLREIAEEKKVMLVDLVNIFSNIPEREKLFYDGCHLKPEGDKIIAQKLAEVLYNVIREK